MHSIQFVAQLIKDICDERNVSINKMLIESGAGARTYYNMVAGSYPSADKIAKIADYLDCSVDYLLGRTDIPEVNRGDCLEKPKDIINALDYGSAVAAHGAETRLDKFDSTGADEKNLIDDM